MNKYSKLLLLVVLLCSVIFIGTYAYHVEVVGVDKKESYQEGGYGKMGEVSAYAKIVKLDEYGDPLTNVRFRLSTYNDIYQFNSFNMGNGNYQFDNSFESEEDFDEAYKVLSPVQKKLLII